MVIYELTHIFFQYKGEIVCSPKKLGLFSSCDSTQQAVQYYSSQPGFDQNQEAFCVRERDVIGNITDESIFEVVVYFHTEDYEFEYEIELGLFGDEATAQNRLNNYCTNNARMINTPNIIMEKIINKCFVGKKAWIEGFSVSE